MRWRPTSRTRRHSKACRSTRSPVQPSSPANVKTHVTGTLPAAVPFDMTITETLGVVKAPDQINHAPAVIRSSHSSGLGNILDVIAAVVLGPFRNILVAEFLELRSKTADTDTQVTGMMQSLLEGVPLHYPFNRKNFFKDSSSVADFPVLITDWQTFGVLGERLVGTGLTTLHPRQQADAGVSISGPTTISGFQGEMDLVSKQTYTFSLSDLAPDPTAFAGRSLVLSRAPAQSTARRSRSRAPSRLCFRCRATSRSATGHTSSRSMPSRHAEERGPRHS